MKKFIYKPKDRDELYKIIEEIVTNQEKEPSYLYGLKDVDTSLITNMYGLFSCYMYNKNNNINKKINWNDPRNDITNWDVSNVTNMVNIFINSQFNQNLGKWIFTLDKKCNIYYFNNNSEHEKLFGRIMSYNEFIEKQLTKDFIYDIFKNGSDVDRYKLLKILKNNRDIVKDLNIDRELL